MSEYDPDLVERVAEALHDADPVPSDEGWPCVAADEHRASAHAALAAIFTEARSPERTRAEAELARANDRIKLLHVGIEGARENHERARRALVAQRDEWREKAQRAEAKEARALESSRRLFVETRDLRIRAEKAEAALALALNQQVEAERKYADLCSTLRGLLVSDAAREYPTWITRALEGLL